MLEEKKELEFNNPSEVESQRKEMDFDANKKPIESKQVSSPKSSLNMPKTTPSTQKQLNSEVTGMFKNREEAQKWLNAPEQRNLSLKDVENVRSRIDKAFPVSLKEKRKEWHKGLRENQNIIQNAMKETNDKYRKGEIGNREYNKIYRELSKRYDVGAYPKPERLPIEDDIDNVQKEWQKVRDELTPLQDEDRIAFNKHLMFNTPYDEKNKNPRIAELSKQLNEITNRRGELRKQKALQIGQSFGRKDYRQQIDERNYGKGNDRIYSLYQKSLEEPGLDFSRMIANDIDENREQYPDRIEFEDDLYEISKSGGAYDHYTKENGEWEHVSTGTIAGLGNELADKLEQENIIESKESTNYDEVDGDYERSYGPVDFSKENDPRKLVDFIDKHIGDGDVNDSVNNAMERLEELVEFTPAEYDKIATGTGEEIIDILRSKLKSKK